MRASGWSAAIGRISRHQSITQSDLEKKRWPPMSMRQPLYSTVRESAADIVRGFQHDGLHAAVADQFQRGGEAGRTGADDDDLGFH
jgi:hypothetical protein